MPAPKYNWDKLKAEYMVSHDITLKAFCIRKGLGAPSKNSYIARKTAGWASEKEEVQKKAMDKYVKQAADELLMDTKSVRLEHAKLAAEVIKKAMEYIRSEAAEIKSVEQARKLLETGIKVQQTALGIKDSPGKDQKLTQVNIYASKYGLEEADEEELIEIIGAIGDARRERLASSGKSSKEESGSEVITEVEEIS